MRTKTLALSAVIGALGTAASMAANVYSVNAVGYINVTMPPGFSIVTCPLIVGTDTEYAPTYGGVAVTNDLNVVFNNDNGQYNSAEVFQFNNGATFGNVDLGTAGVTAAGQGWGGSTSLAAGPWGAAGQSDYGQGVLLTPGTAVFFHNQGHANMTATFVGSVPQGSLTNVLVRGYSCVGSVVPVSGDLVLNSISGAFFNSTVNATGHGATGPANGDFVQQYTAGIGYYTDGSWSGSWSSPNGPIDPSVSSPAQGFLYWNAGNDGAAASGSIPAKAELWIENFTINP
ncbi:MAG: hypothetical protein ABSA83_08565 [Verrucomicrobiota bacterium]|jgi:hypothetical protein